MQVTVYVPAAGEEVSLGILPGSAIVGTPHHGWASERSGITWVKDEVTIDYEGGKYDNMRTFADKLLHAAGRHEQRYPTVARQFVPADLLFEVGTYDTQTRELHVTDSEKLGSWLGVAWPTAEEALAVA
jgi:hypothetical protein